MEFDLAGTGNDHSAFNSCVLCLSGHAFTAEIRYFSARIRHAATALLVALFSVGVSRSHRHHAIFIIPNLVWLQTGNRAQAGDCNDETTVVVLARRRAYAVLLVV